MKRVLNVPLFVILIAICAAAMMVPAAHGWALRDWDAARGFFQASLLGGVIACMLGLAMINTPSRNLLRTHLISLPVFFLVLPVYLAVPLREIVDDTTFFNAYFEMVSSLTTTGATVFDDPGRLPDPVHLWRAIVGWLGGLFLWTTAFAVLAPNNMGGFEVISSSDIGRGAGRYQSFVRRTDPRERLLRYAQALTPVYVLITSVLWIALLLAGEVPLVAACHAMSVVATSGISPVGGLEGSGTGRIGEALMLCFMVFAVTRLSFNNEARQSRWWVPGRDPEFTMATLLITLVPLFLFLRHWLGAYDVDEEQNIVAALRALWGGVFTVASFLTTTGFVSVDWVAARDWSGLQTPGMILLGLCIIGGGVATTAGGVRLLRVYALYRHGYREMDKLVHPSSVGGAGPLERHIRRQGAMVAWVFFMLFAITIALVMMALAVTGLDFETSTVLAVAALSNTGPAAGAAAGTAISYGALDTVAKAILCGAMVIGRVETLVIIALMNPAFWRN